MLKVLYGILTAPLSLPFHPVIDYLICILIGEAAFYLQYRCCPRFSAYLEKRTVLRWFIRILFYLAIWTLLYVGVYAGETLEEYWYLIAFAVVVLHMLAIGFIVLYRESGEKESEEEE